MSFSFQPTVSLEAIPWITDRYGQRVSGVEYKRRVLAGYYPSTRKRGFSGFFQRALVPMASIVVGAGAFGAAGAGFGSTGGSAVSLMFPSPLSGIGDVLGLVQQGVGLYNQIRGRQPAMQQSTVASAGGLMPTAFPALPAIGGVIGRALPAIVGGGAVVARGARAVVSSAASYCRRHPGWCASIGGLGAVQAMIQSGQLPPVRRSRGRGISSREFRSFRRVHSVLSKFCAPKMSIRRKKR